MGEETLGRLVVMHAGKAKSVADLFCGLGPFALRLAEKMPRDRYRQRPARDRAHWRAPRNRRPA